MLCNDFLNSLEEKTTAHYGTIFLISFTKTIFKIAYESNVFEGEMFSLEREINKFGFLIE